MHPAPIELITKNRWKLCVLAALHTPIVVSILHASTGNGKHNSSIRRSGKKTQANRLRTKWRKKKRRSELTELSAASSAAIRYLHDNRLYVSNTEKIKHKFSVCSMPNLLSERVRWLTHFNTPFHRQKRRQGIQRYCNPWCLAYDLHSNYIVLSHSHLLVLFSLVCFFYSLYLIFAFCVDAARLPFWWNFLIHKTFGETVRGE